MKKTMRGLTVICLILVLSFAHKVPGVAVQHHIHDLIPLESTRQGYFAVQVSTGTATTSVWVMRDVEIAGRGEVITRANGRVYWRVYFNPRGREFVTVFAGTT